MEHRPSAESVSTEIDQIATETSKMLRGRLTGFRIDVRSGGIVLSGNARSFYAKQLALHAVMNGIKLPIVRNEIDVT